MEFIIIGGAIGGGLAACIYLMYNAKYLTRKKMDLRKVPGLEDSDIVCKKCGGVYLVEIDEKGEPCLECNQCDNRMYVY